MYRYYSHGELVGHSGPELPQPPEAPARTPRSYVFVPGPSFPRVWPVLERFQRASGAMVRAMLAARESDRSGEATDASPAEIAAMYARYMPSELPDAMAAVKALALELRDAAGNAIASEGVMVVEYPSDVTLALPAEMRAEVNRLAPALGFRGEPPYYALMVPSDVPS